MTVSPLRWALPHEVSYWNTSSTVFDSSLSSGQDFITTDQLQRRMQMVEKNVDKGHEQAEILFEENEQKQEGESDISTRKEEEGNQQVLNEIAEEANGGEKKLVM